MLTQRFPAPAAAGPLASQDLLGILKLMSAPEDIRRMLLDASKAEAGARTALNELAETQAELDAREAAAAATEIAWFAISSGPSSQVCWILKSRGLHSPAFRCRFESFIPARVASSHTQRTVVRVSCTSVSRPEPGSLAPLVRR
jgi:hypothetical protein